MVADMSLSPESQIRQLQALLEISKMLGSEVQLERLLNLILEKTTELMDAERSSLFLYDPKKNELWSKIAQGMQSQEIRFPLGKGIAGDVARTLQIANIPDAYADARFNPEFDLKTDFKTHSVLCLPIVGNDGKLIGVIQVLNKKTGEPFNSDDENLLTVLGAHAAVALQRAQFIATYVENQRMNEALKLTREIQMDMLPKKFPPFPDKVDVLDIYAKIEPAKDVAGDLYDFFLIDDTHLCFVIGDVSGKGVPAALFMAITDTALKAVTSEKMTPREIVKRLNTFLCKNNDATMFCTLLCGILNLQTGHLEYCNAGHNPPYILRKNGDVIALQPEEGCALGIREDMKFSSQSISLDKGDGIFLYTDGVNEAMNEEDALYSLERLKVVLHQVFNESAQNIVEKVIAEVKKHIGESEQADDITVLVLRRPL